MARWGQHTAIGAARLDNRRELAGWTDSRLNGVSDLDLVVRLVALHGPSTIRHVLGDFAVVVWDQGRQAGLAACDAFAVRRLHYAERDGLFAFASRAEALATDNRYDLQYLAELVGGCSPSEGRSPYAAVRSLPGGTVATLAGNGVSLKPYWSAYDIATDPAWNGAEESAIHTCRRLLAEGVRSRVSSDGSTWAQLSGGMDSSSVVSLTQALVERGDLSHGLGGTVTYVDSYGTGGDEREYSDAVIERWPLTNAAIVDAPIWWDDEAPPPWLDAPSSGLMFYPREHRLAELVWRAGGRVLLTGVGGDNLFGGNMLFFADWLVRGQARAACREMARRATIGRASFWELAYRNALVPLLPPRLRARLLRDPGQMPPWVTKAAAEQYGLATQASAPLRCGGNWGEKYHHAVAVTVGSIAGALSYELIERLLDVRHPYLYRPLVEFALSLPPELCIQPHAHKWIVREAMHGILPDAVRHRIGKGSSDASLARSLIAQHALLGPLAQESMLADLGIVDGAQLRRAFASIPGQADRREKVHAALEHTLAVEAWLQLRSGRWPHGTDRMMPSTHIGDHPSSEGTPGGLYEEGLHRADRAQPRLGCAANRQQQRRARNSQWLHRSSWERRVLSLTSSKES